jgi:hypothetical protein
LAAVESSEYERDLAEDEEAFVGVERDFADRAD